MPLTAAQITVRNTAAACLSAPSRRSSWPSQRRHHSAGAVAATAGTPAGPASGGSSTGRSTGLSSGVPTQHSFATRQQPAAQQAAGGAGNCAGGFCSTRALVLYSCALEYARSERWEVARRVFAKTVAEFPDFVKPWVSWAQMEKRCASLDEERRWDKCRTVLQRGLLHNRDAPALLQAWGLMEMQRGNFLAALLLLDRSAQLDPRNAPVLRWKPVVHARQTVGQRRGGKSAASRS